MGNQMILKMFIFIIRLKTIAYLHSIQLIKQSNFRMNTTTAVIPTTRTVL